MSSRAHGSEDALGVLGCRRARALARPCVLIGGLGMGFTLRAALDVLPAEALVVVAELVPAVVEWNRGPLGVAAGYPLKDPRVCVQEGDVAVRIGSSTAAFDAILLDVDNGPAAMTTASNKALYDGEGLVRLRASLRPGGILAVWSARDESRLRENAPRRWIRDPARARTCAEGWTWRATHDPRRFSYRRFKRMGGQSSKELLSSYAPNLLFCSVPTSLCLRIPAPAS